MSNYTILKMFENPRRGRQARNFTTNAPKIRDLKSSSEQIFSRKLPLGAPVENTIIKYDHITEGLKSLNWLNVNDRLLVNDLLMVHKCIHDLIPSYLTGKFIQRSKIHGRNTRGSGELDLPICRLKTGQRSFAFRGAKLYSNLPNEIKQTSDVKKFKAKVCNYLLN